MIKSIKNILKFGLISQKSSRESNRLSLRNHPFLDGNKRTSFFSAILFLEYNGWNVEFKIKDGVEFTRQAHDQDYTVEQISKWLKEHSVKFKK